MTLSEDIAKYLVSKGLGALGTNIGPEMPPLPDDFLSVREYAGGPPLHVKGIQAPVIRTPRFQVVCRSKNTRAAMMRAEDAFRHLSGLSSVLSGTAYRVRALQDPFPIGRDEGGRERVVANYEVMK